MSDISRRNFLKKIRDVLAVVAVKPVFDRVPPPAVQESPEFDMNSVFESMMYSSCGCATSFCHSAPCPTHEYTGEHATDFSMIGVTMIDEKDWRLSRHED